MDKNERWVERYKRVNDRRRQFNILHRAERFYFIKKTPGVRMAEYRVRTGRVSRLFARYKNGNEFRRVIFVGTLTAGKKMPNSIITTRRFRTYGTGPSSYGAFRTDLANVTADRTTVQTHSFASLFSVFFFFIIRPSRSKMFRFGHGPEKWSDDEFASTMISPLETVEFKFTSRPTSFEWGHARFKGDALKTPSAERTRLTCGALNFARRQRTVGPNSRAWLALVN